MRSYTSFQIEIHFQRNVFASRNVDGFLLVISKHVVYMIICRETIGSNGGELSDLL